MQAGQSTHDEKVPLVVASSPAWPSSTATPTSASEVVGCNNPFTIWASDLSFNAGHIASVCSIFDQQFCNVLPP